MAHQLPTTDDTAPLPFEKNIFEPFGRDASGNDLTDAELRRRLGRLCDDVLPALATVEDYPVRFDHCFRRLAYDTAVGAEWTDVIDRPFVENASSEQLATAYRVAAWLVRAGPPAADACQESSLAHRGLDG